MTSDNNECMQCVLLCYAYITLSTCFIACSQNMYTAYDPKNRCENVLTHMA